MISKKNEVLIVKNTLFKLIVELEKKFTKHINKDNVDSQAIFALTKLVDSFVKISQLEVFLDPKELAQHKLQDVSDEDKGLLTLYNELIEKKEKMAPRAGLEPATERLTAACSTTELPGN